MMLVFLVHFKEGLIITGYNLYGMNQMTIKKNKDKEQYLQKDGGFNFYIYSQKQHKIKKIWYILYGLVVCFSFF